MNRIYTDTSSIYLDTPNPFCEMKELEGIAQKPLELGKQRDVNSGF